MALINYSIIPYYIALSEWIIIIIKSFFPFL